MDSPAATEVKELDTYAFVIRTRAGKYSGLNRPAHNLTRD